MNAALIDLIFYAFGIFILFLTPGPVWIVILARSMSNGVRGAWPLALGVAMGDIIWPLTAILGLNWILGESGEYLYYLKWIAALIFLIMGIALLRQGETSLSENKALSRPGKLHGFLAGVAVILGNPKAILFYMGILPGFFDLNDLTTLDIGIILIVSAIIPMSGNITLALLVERVRGLLQSKTSVRRINIISGLLLIGVGTLIPFT